MTDASDRPDPLSPDPPSPHDEEFDTEAGLELLARAVEYLSVCRRDPVRASETDDPGLLIEGLRSLLNDLSSSRTRFLSREEEPPAAA